VSIINILLALICSDLLCPSVQVLAEVLKVNTSVRDIHLERNGIGIEGAKARLADSPVDSEWGPS